MASLARSAIITGTGMYVPDRVVTNDDLKQWMETSDEWIQQRSGIKERRFIDEKDAPSDLGERACRQALKNANLTVKDIDLLIIASLSPEHFFPGTSSFIQRKLGMEGTPCFDLRAQCTGFIYSLDMARALVVSGQYRRVLLCGVEVHSRAVDLSTRGRDVAVLFGDGAGAIIIEASPDPEQGILSTSLHSDGTYAEKLWVDAPRMSTMPHISAAMVEEGLTYPKMDGKFVFKMAVQKMPEVLVENLQKLHLSIEDVDHFVFHQANLRINEFVAQTLHIPFEKTYNNIDRYGNCSAASIPICLAELNQAGRLKKGQLVCMTGFGSGFSWGSSVVRWS